MILLFRSRKCIWLSITNQLTCARLKTHARNPFKLLPLLSLQQQERRRSITTTKLWQQKQEQQRQQRRVSYDSKVRENENGDMPRTRMNQKQRRSKKSEKRVFNRQRHRKKDIEKEQQRNVIRPPKNYLKKLPKPKKEHSIPPTLLTSTASPYVYIAQTALGRDDDNDDDDYESTETRINPSTLFSEVAQMYNTHDDSIGDQNVNWNNKYIPPLLTHANFEYFSPKSLNYGYPVQNKPEVAFLGRSNVGKSSLINALMRKNLCVTSKSPGRTQLPYYYGLVPNNHTGVNQSMQQPKGFIVDLPGYGFVSSKPQSIAEDWQKDTQDLLMHRRHDAGVLKRLFILMDSRRGIQGPNVHDRVVMRWLEDAEIPYTIVLTKADRVSVPIVVRQVNDFCLRYASQPHNQYNKQNNDNNLFGVAQSPVVHVTSSTKGWGINELMLSIEAEFYEDDD